MSGPYASFPDSFLFEGGDSPSVSYRTGKGDSMCLCRLFLQFLPCFARNEAEISREDWRADSATLENSNCWSILLNHKTIIAGVNLRMRFHTLERAEDRQWLPQTPEQTEFQNRISEPMPGSGLNGRIFEKNQNEMLRDLQEICKKSTCKESKRA